MYHVLLATWVLKKTPTFYSKDCCHHLLWVLKRYPCPRHLVSKQHETQVLKKIPVCHLHTMSLSPIVGTQKDTHILLERLLPTSIVGTQKDTLILVQSQ